MKTGKEVYEILNPYCLVNNKLTFIEEHNSEEWKKLECICPKCKETLIARMGNQRVHHFYHRRKTNCVGGYESALHLLAKELIAAGCEILLPEYSIEEFKQDETAFFLLGDQVLFDNKALPSSRIKPERITVEEDIDGEIRPDLLVEYKGRKLIIEIFVTHAVDEKKRKRIEESGISAVEIDLSEYHKKGIAPDELERIISESIEEKKWVFNRRVSDMYKLLNNDTRRASILLNCPQKLTKSDRISNLGSPLDVIENQKGLIAKDCPAEHFRKFNGLFYYSQLETCIQCKFFMGNLFSYPDKKQQNIICSNEKDGHCIEIEDFISWAKKTIDECSRFATYSEILETIKQNLKVLTDNQRINGNVAEALEKIRRYLTIDKVKRSIIWYADTQVRKARCSLESLIDKAKKKFEIKDDDRDCINLVNIEFSRRWYLEIQEFEKKYLGAYSIGLAGLVSVPEKNESFSDWFLRMIDAAEPFAPDSIDANYVPWLWKAAKDLYQRHKT